MRQQLLRLAVAISCTVPSIVTAQVCGDSLAAQGPANGHGLRIHLVRIELSPLEVPARIRWAAEAVNTTTKPETVCHFLLFHAGDVLDTTTVEESLRRIRSLGILSTVEAITTPGNDTTGATITVRARETWTTRATMRTPNASGAGSLSLERRNIFGTARTVRAVAGSSHGQVAFGLSYRDPWVAGSNFHVELSQLVSRGGTDWFGSVRREHRDEDRWWTELSVGRTSQALDGKSTDHVQRNFGSLLLARRLQLLPQSVTSLVFGVEAQNTRAVMSSTEPTVEPNTVDRAFAGVGVGLSRRSLEYRPALNLLAGGRLAKLPTGLDGELMIGVGRDRVTRKLMLHPDIWLGKIWITNRRSVLTANLFASGYQSANTWTGATIRATVGLFREAPFGTWAARVSAETLVDPDPDTRTLSEVDVTSRYLPRSDRAETAVTARLERTRSLTPTSSRIAIAGAAFVAGSIRWMPSGTPSSNLFIAMPGIGLRIMPSRIGQSTLRLDLGFPVLVSGGLDRHPRLTLTVSRWIESGRHRDGLRSP